jgi:hypothetical protein
VAGPSCIASSPPVVAAPQLGDLLLSVDQFGLKPILLNVIVTFISVASRLSQLVDPVAEIAMD